MKYIISLLPILYFAIAWFFPWDHFQGDSTISISYFFDIVFVILVIFSFRLFNFKPKIELKGLGTRVLATLGAATFSLFIINLFALKAPFKFVDHLVLQILILAPIIEELIFRQVFFGVFEKIIHKKNHQLILNSALFSLSHLAAYWSIPEEFRGFIIAQVGYTFVLGWLCAKSRMKTNTVFEPILLHFIFNLVFYAAVMKGMI